jgi:hypothetical protein
MLVRRAFSARLGGAAAVAAMSPEAKADALEHHMKRLLDDAASGGGAAKKKFPTVAEVEAQVETRRNRRGVGNLFLSSTGNVTKLQPMPEKPTLIDFFKLRYSANSNQVLQSANGAMKTGMTEEIILASLLHDTVQELIKVDHGWWGNVFGENYKPEPYIEATRRSSSLPISSAGISSSRKKDWGSTMARWRICGVRSRCGIIRCRNGTLEKHDQTL